MLETGSYHEYDAVILVTAPEHLRLERLLQRDNMDKKSALNLMRKQWRDNRRRPLATVEIINDSDLETLKARTWKAIEQLGVPRSVS